PALGGRRPDRLAGSLTGFRQRDRWVEQIDEAIRLADLPAARARTVAVLGDEQAASRPRRWTCSIAPLETPMVGTGTSLNLAVAGSLVLTAWLGSSDRAN